MKRPLSRLWFVGVIAVVTICLPPSCGFGTAGVALGVGSGGGGGAPASVVFDLSRDPQDIGTAAKPGQVVAGELAQATAPSLGSDAYLAVWIGSGGRVLATTKVQAMTSRRIAACVPLGLPTGDYVLQIDIGEGVARLPVPVTASGLPPDADVVIGEVRTWWGNQLSLLQTYADADTDLARKARAVADLTRVAAWLSTYDAALSSLDALSKSLLAQALLANAALRAAGPENQYPSVDLVVAQSAAAATLAELGLSATAGSGSAAVASGLPDGVVPMLAASQQIGGLLAVVTAYDRWTRALATPCKPVGGLQVTKPDGAGLSLLFTQPQPLRVRVSLQGLVVGDEALDARLTPLASSLVAASVRRGQLFPVVEDVLDTLVPTPPALSASGGFDVAPSRLELVAQTPGPGLPVLVLEPDATSQAASLRASEFPLTSGAVLANFRLAEGALLGAAELQLSVQLVALPPDLNMAPIPSGTFQMGSPIAPLGVEPYFNQADAQPVHLVTISRPFWMGRYEVTQAQYQMVMGTNPSFFQGASYPDGPQRPVERVTWFAAVAYCEALTASEAAAGRLPPGYVYRLPTEAEWEYCCRAETTTAYSEYHYGAMLLCGQANFNFSYHSGSGGSSCLNPGGVQTAAVGNYVPNAFGLYDMHGNVWEWCQDSWNLSSNYPAGLVTDPLVSIGPFRVFRGGGWTTDSFVCRSAYRNFSDPASANSSSGFRVVCAPVLP